MECVLREQGEIGMMMSCLHRRPRASLWALVYGDLGGRSPHEYRDKGEAMPVRKVALEYEPDALSVRLHRALLRLRKRGYLNVDWATEAKRA